MGKTAFDFSDERFVVTGASSGMGRRVALDLAEAGANVLAIGRNEGRLAETCAQCPQRIFPAALDACDSAALEQAIRAFVQQRGKLNGSVHAAGIVEFTPLRSYDDTAARRIMATSFWAGMEVLRLVTKRSYASNGTSTVLFSSVCAQSHEKGMFAYSAAKAALDAGIRSAAKELYRGKHRVNTILPGWVESPMTDTFGSAGNGDPVRERQLLGLGLGSDVSGMVLFLLSDAARWITGSNVVVDGGYLA